MNKQAGNIRKILKAFAVSFVALVIVSLIIALFKSKTYEVSRSQQMNASIEKVFPLIAQLDQWKQWSPWFEIEPTAEFTNMGTPGQIGSTLTWNGKIIGVGELKLAEVVPNQKAVFQIHIRKPAKMDTVSEFYFDSKDGSTVVTWTDRGNLSYPIGRLFKQNIEAMLARDFEQGLSKIKNVAEASK